MTIDKAGAVALLDLLAEYKRQIDDITVECEAAEMVAMPLDVRKRVEAVRKDHEKRLEPIRQRLKSAEGQVEAFVLESGQTLKGQSVTATYNGGRVTYKDLEEYVKTHPDLLAYRKEGKKYVKFQYLERREK